MWDNIEKSMQEQVRKHKESKEHKISDEDKEDLR